MVVHACNVVPVSGLNLHDGAFKVRAKLTAHGFKPLAFQKLGAAFTVPFAFGEVRQELTSVARLVHRHVTRIADNELVSRLPCLLVFDRRIVEANIAHDILINLVFGNPYFLLQILR